MSAAFIARGIPALGVDWRFNRHETEAEWLSLNVATDEGLEDLLKVAGGCPDLQLVWVGGPEQRLFEGA